jgi:hypothetical protein
MVIRHIDPNIETAISIKNSLHNIMRMTKQQLQQNISNSQETVDVLCQHTVFKNKTIEDLRICLITTAVYEHLRNKLITMCQVVNVYCRTGNGNMN